MNEPLNFVIPKFVNLNDWEQSPKPNEEVPVKENDEPIIFTEEEWAQLPKANDGDFGYDENDFKDISSVKENVTSDSKEAKISPAQLESIARWARGLRREEAAVVIDNLPLDLIFAKIGKELEKSKKFTDAIKGAMDIIK